MLAHPTEGAWRFQNRAVFAFVDAALAAVS